MNGNGERALGKRRSCCRSYPWVEPDESQDVRNNLRMLARVLIFEPGGWQRVAFRAMFKRVPFID
jgi:hypothetical protein